MLADPTKTPSSQELPQMNFQPYSVKADPYQILYLSKKVQKNIK